MGMNGMMVTVKMKVTVEPSAPRIPRRLFQNPSKRSAPNSHSATPRNQLAPRMPSAGCSQKMSGVVRAPERGARAERPAIGAQLQCLVMLMRTESAVDSLGGRVMLNALSTAMFALTLRVGSESDEAPPGLLALAGNPRLAPALAAMFQEPARAWTLPELARLCHMSRATLARNFQERLGRSASDLLTDIRMTLAAN